MPPGNSPVIVLMTDFGLSDTYVGQMKGVILSIAPSLPIIDLTHAVTPQNIAQGAFLLGKSIPFFPDGSIFVAVVDPGVGTSRRAIAVLTDRHIFLAPDNGLLTAIIQNESIERCISINITEKRYLLTSVSSTFHGRDVFSPAAAHLACGVPVQELGEEIEPSSCTRIPMYRCSSPDNGASWEGSVIFTDHYGNLVTSLDSGLLDRAKQWVVRAGTSEPLPLYSTYGDVADRQPLAYRGSFGMIEIAVRNGNAAEVLGLRDGDRVKGESAFVASEKT